MNQSLPDIVLAAVSETTEQFFAIWVVIGVLVSLLIYPFRRIIGGDQAAPAGTGGGESRIVGVIWILAAVTTGIYISR